MTAGRPLVVGIDVGGTHMQVGVVDDHAAIVGRIGLETEAAHGLEHVIDRIEEGIEASCREASVTTDSISAVGVAAAGAIDWPRGIVLDAPNLGWRDVHLRERLAKRLDRPVVVENDVNGAMWGEYRLGGHIERGDALGVWVGTGIGGGLIFGGHLYRGERHTAGEIGQTIIDPAAAPGLRTVEERCSRSGMQRQLAAAETGTRAPGTTELARRYAANEAAVVRVVDASAELLGIALANWVTVLAVSQVIVGGGVVETFGDVYLEPLRRAFRADVFPSEHAACPIVPTKLAADAGLLGAALLAQELV